MDLDLIVSRRQSRNQKIAIRAAHRRSELSGLLMGDPDLGLDQGRSLRIDDLPAQPRFGELRYRRSRQGQEPPGEGEKPPLSEPCRWHVEPSVLPARSPYPMEERHAPSGRFPFSIKPADELRRVEAVWAGLEPSRICNLPAPLPPANRIEKSNIESQGSLIQLLA